MRLIKLKHDRKIIKPNDLYIVTSRFRTVRDHKSSRVFNARATPEAQYIYGDVLYDLFLAHITHNNPYNEKNCKLYLLRLRNNITPLHMQRRRVQGDL